MDGRCLLLRAMCFVLVAPLPLSNALMCDVDSAKAYSTCKAGIEAKHGTTMEASKAKVADSKTVTQQEVEQACAVIGDVAKCIPESCCGEDEEESYEDVKKGAEYCGLPTTCKPAPDCAKVKFHLCVNDLRQQGSKEEVEQTESDLDSGDGTKVSKSNCGFAEDIMKCIPGECCDQSWTSNMQTASVVARNSVCKGYALECQGPGAWQFGKDGARRDVRSPVCLLASGILGLAAL